MQLRVKQREELAKTISMKEKFSMALIEAVARKDEEPLVLCCANGLRDVMNVTVEKSTPSKVLYCGGLIEVMETTDIVTCGRYITDFHVDACGTIRLHKLLRGRKLIIIATSRDKQHADYYNAFKNARITYDVKLERVLRDPEMWDVIIQDQRFLLLVAF